MGNVMEIRIFCSKSVYLSLLSPPQNNLEESGVTIPKLYKRPCLKGRLQKGGKGTPTILTPYSSTFLQESGSDKHNHRGAASASFWPWAGRWDLVLDPWPLKGLLPSSGEGYDLRGPFTHFFLH